MRTTHKRAAVSALLLLASAGLGGCHGTSPGATSIANDATAHVVADPPATTAPETIRNHVDGAPRLGHITIGAFAPETMPGSSLSLTSLDDDSTYAAYRTAVRDTYGADLADMNYLGVGTDGWQARYATFQDWLLRAGKYGDPTIAIEPVGPAGYGAFRDGPEMRALRDAFEAADRAGIVVWVRFASESNLRFSPYSVYESVPKQKAYRESVRWFRRYMPANTRLVFSPLINTAYLKRPSQLQTLIGMYEPGAYDRIGGTLYATSWLRPKDAFDWYYHFMRRLDPATPFQICELGGTYPRAPEIEAFLVRVARGDWPDVRRVNLFAGDLNNIAVANHGHFGFVLPGAQESYLHDLFTENGTSATYAELASGRRLALMEQIGAGRRSGDMTLGGSIARIYHEQAMFDMKVDTVTDEIGDVADLSPARTKRVLITPECDGAVALGSAHPGDAVQVTGWDSGVGTPLRASRVDE